jgi:integrase
MSNPDYDDVGAGLDPITARSFLAAITDDRLYALYFCAIVLGLRRGGLLGLTWAAVDLDAGRLTVRQALAWVALRAVLQLPKTRAGAA